MVHNAPVLPVLAGTSRLRDAASRRRWASPSKEKASTLTPKFSRSLNDLVGKKTKCLVRKETESIMLGACFVSFHLFCGQETNYAPLFLLVSRRPIQSFPLMDELW
jgi:hypothetical protein